jgi:acyl carrier protein
MQNSEAGTKDTLSTIQSMLAKEYGFPIERLGPDQCLADLGIDSLTTIEFMFKLEDEFSISLSEERGTLTTVGDIANLVNPVRDKNRAKPRTP